MRRFLYHILFFVVIPVLFVALIEFSYMNRPEIYLEKKAYLDANADSIETLFLGNSQIINGIIPELFEDMSYNAALQVQTLFYSNLVLKKYSKRLTNLRRVVVNITSPSMFTNHREVSEFAFYYSRHFGIHWSNNIKYRLATLSIPPRQAVQHARKYYTQPYVRSMEAVGTGGFYVYNSDIEFDLEFLAKRAYDTHSKRMSMDHLLENTGDLKDLIETTDRLHVELIILKTPEYKAYVNYLDDVYKNVFHQTLTDISGLCSHCRYLDYTEDEQFKDSDFADAIHLNRTGAEKFSLLLDAEFN